MPRRKGQRGLRLVEAARKKKLLPEAKAVLKENTSTSIQNVKRTAPLMEKQQPNRKRNKNSKNDNTKKDMAPPAAKKLKVESTDGKSEQGDMKSFIAQVMATETRGALFSNRQSNRVDENCEFLLKLFCALDACISLIKSRRQPPVFSRVKEAVEAVLHREFSLKNLAQLVGIWPETFRLSVHQQFQGPHEIDFTGSPPPRQTDSSKKKREIRVEINVECAEEGLRNDMAYRRSEFLARLNKLEKDETGRLIIPEGRLPSLSDHEPQSPKATLFLKSKTKKESPCKDSCLSLLERIKAKEARLKSYEQQFSSKEEQKKKELAYRLPEVSDMIHSYFLQTQRNGCRLNHLVDHLTTVSKKATSTEEMHIIIDLISEIVPEWCGKELDAEKRNNFSNDCSAFVKIDKKIHYGSIRRKIYTFCNAETSKAPSFHGTGISPP